MKFKPFAFLFLLCVCSCMQQRPADLFTLKGRAIGMDSGTVIITYPDSLDRPISDTTKIKNEYFAFEGYIRQPTKTRVQIAGRGQYLYFEPADMLLTADTAHFARYTLSGSTTQEKNDLFSEIAARYSEALRVLSEQIKPIEEKLKTNPDKTVHDSLESARKQLQEQKSKIYEALGSEQDDLLLTHPSFLTVVLFDRFDEFPVDSQKNIINRLPAEIRQYPAVRKIEDTFPKKAGSLKGTKAFDFKATDIMTGNDISLSDFRGKYVLLDFWASWCGPCRMLIPQLKKTYSTFHDRGLEIIAISHDADLDKWKEAIAEEKTENWHHVLNVREPGTSTPDDIKNKFYIKELPTQLLIGPDGTILGRWVGFSERNIQGVDAILNEKLN